MEIRLNLQYDSHNTTPTDELVLSSATYGGQTIFFRISNENREVSVDAKELEKAVAALK